MPGAAVVAAVAAVAGAVGAAAPVCQDRAAGVAAECHLVRAAECLVRAAVAADTTSAVPISRGAEWAAACSGRVWRSGRAEPAALAARAVLVVPAELAALEALAARAVLVVPAALAALAARAVLVVPAASVALVARRSWRPRWRWPPRKRKRQSAWRRRQCRQWQRQ